MPIAILGLPFGVFLMWTSAFFFLSASIIILKPLHNTNDKLIKAFFVWLVGMGFLHALLGAGLFYNVTALIYLGIFFGFSGSAYLLHIPLAGLLPGYEKIGFYLALLAGWIIIAWLIVFPESHDMQTTIDLLFSYMIIVAGILPGPYLIWMGMKAKDRAIKVKGIGGGIGILTCCLFADAMAVFIYRGVGFWSEFFMALSPVILISSVIYGRYLEKERPSQAVPEIRA